MASGVFPSSLIDAKSPTVTEVVEVSVDAPDSPASLAAEQQSEFSEQASGTISPLTEMEQPSPMIKPAVDGSFPPAPLTPEEKTDKLLEIMTRYRMNTSNSKHHEWQGRTRVYQQVLSAINNNDRVRMILPAFPFKSPNKVTKVLGVLPDKAEEVALRHMNGLCKMIEEVYDQGADLFIVSDGLMYNDILEISDAEVWQYSTALRELAKNQDCINVKFCRLVDLLGITSDEPITEESYLVGAPSYRQKLIDEFLGSGFDVDTFIKNDPDATLTYRGYIKFLEKDLEHSPRLAGLSKNQRSRAQEETAKKMMVRGKAFAAAIAQRFPEHVRLSIHASASDATKLSVSLLPQTNIHAMTPWHSSLVREVDGSISLAHAHTVPALTHDLIYENGRPSYFRAKSDLFNWPGMDVTFEYMYPTGIVIRATNPNTRYSLADVRMQKVRGLAEKCSPIVLRGFADTQDERVFQSKAYDAGDVLPWTFGIMAKVKDAGSKDRLANNVVSSEAMPMHYDGMFKFTKKVVHEDGSETMESNPPRFQYFVGQTTAPKGSGYTLFAASRLFFQHLPPQYTQEELEKITWDCRNSGFWDCHMKKLPLIIKHPVNNKPCVRWHEPWPAWKTKFAHCIITIENGSQEYIKLVDSMLYDRRVCLYFEWEKGDVVVSDNVNMLHTRSAFDGNCDRELWRIHFD